MEEEKENKKELVDQVCEKVEGHIKKIVDEGITSNNLDVLYKLVDIHKDIKNEKYWESKEEMNMRYYDENQFGADSYGRRSYRGDDMYGRGRSRDSMGRFKGDDMMNEMHDSYRRYEAGRQGYNNYGGNESMKALEYMLELNTNFIDMLKRDAKSPEEHQIIDEYTRKMSQM